MALPSAPALFSHSAASVAPTLAKPAFSAGLGFSTMSYGGGYIVATVGYRSLFLVGAVLIAVAALVFWACFRQPRGELAGVPPSEGGG